MVRRSLLLASLALLGCGAAEEVVASGRSEGLGPYLIVPARLDPAESPEASGGAGALLSYAFDGGAPVPAPAASGNLRLVPGEHGVTGTTVAYLPMNAEFGVPLEWGGRAGLELVTQGTARVDGRFGGALRLEEGGSVRLALPGVLGTGAWSVDFWVRPRSRAAATLVQGGEALRIELLADGRLRALFAPGREAEPLVLESDAALAPGAWHHVGLALDGPDIRTLRLSVDGAHRNALAPAFLSAPLDELLLGGSAATARFDLDEFRVSSRALVTGEYEELHAWTPAFGVYRLALNYEGGRVEREVFHGVLTEPEVRGSAWARADLSRAVASEDGLHWVPGQWERYETDVKPLPRTTHCTVDLGDQRVFVFGGETLDTHLRPMKNTNDAWFFHSGAGEWERLETELAPRGRCHQSAAYSPDHGLVFYPMGFVNEHDGEELLDDPWLFDVDQRAWRRASAEGGTGPTCNGATVYVPELEGFLVFAAGRRNTFFYDPAADRWGQLPFRSVDLEGRPVEFVPTGSPMAAHHPPSGDVWIFSGSVGLADKAFSSKTVRFDPQANSFHVMELEPSPEPRVRGSFSYDSQRDRYVLYGGVLGQFSERFSDLWVFDPSGPSWVQVEAAGPPLARGGFYGGSYDPLTDRHVVVCGRHSPNHFLNDAWALSLDERAVGVARYLFDRASFPTRDRLSVRWRESGGAPAALRVRTSEDGVVFGPWRPFEDGAVGSGGRFVEVELTLRGSDLVQGTEIVGLGFGDVQPAAGEDWQALSVPHLAPHLFGG